MKKRIAVAATILGTLTAVAVTAAPAQAAGCVYVHQQCIHP